MDGRRTAPNRGKLLIGLDSGTQSCSASIFSLSGKLLRRASHPQTILTPREDWAEQNPGCWGESAVAALRTAAAGIHPSRFLALGIAFQRETFTLLDAKGRPLRPAILWLDMRAAAQIRDLERRMKPARFRRRTGKQLDATCTLPRMLWLRKNEPRMVRRAARWQDVGAALSAELTGRYATCLAGADTCGLIGLKSRDWIDDYLRMLHMNRRQFPELVEPGAEIGRLSAAAARRTGLPSGLPVVAGGGDGQAFSIGAGAIKPCSMSLSLGTSIVLGANSRRLRISPLHRTLLMRPGTYLLECVLQSGTFLLKWFLDSMGGGVRRQEWERRAALLPPGSGGLLTLPHWWGARFPDSLPNLRGLTLGWGHQHTPAHFYRSLLEGSGFELRRALDVLHRSLPQSRARCIAVGGGGTESRLWRRTLADILGRPLIPVGEFQATARGAAMLAGLGVGLFPNLVAAAAAMCRTPAAIRPDGPHEHIYEQLYREIYIPLFRATSGTNQRLRALIGGSRL